MPPFRADLLTDDQRRLSRRAWIVTLALAAALLVAGVASGAAWRWAFHDLPALPENAETLWTVRREPSVMLLDRNGAVLDVRGPLYSRPAALENLPPHLVHAVLAIEDRRFFQHDGVDWRAFFRAVFVNLREGRSSEGGSTITMQVVKNFILTPERSLRRKIQEIRLALALERRLSKTAILELYLNRIYLGAGAYGVESASRRYFGHPAAELSLAEAALLAALPKAPSRLDPTANLAGARERAALVLAAMEDAGYITADERAEAESDPAILHQAGDDGAAAPDPLLYGHIFDHAVTAARLLAPDAPGDLVIATTIDPVLQRLAHGTVIAALDAEGETLRAGEAALVALAPDGAVRAMVGGRDYAQSQFNRASQARRQPGSAFKPIVFAAAMEAGFSPFSAFQDEPVTLAGWSPGNFGGGFRGRVTLAEALRRSINTVAAQVGAEVGAETVVAMAHRLGIRSALPAFPAIALGAGEVNLTELTGAYAVFANDGLRREPWLIAAITDSRGRPVYERAPPEPERVLEEDVARTISTMLQDVVLNGTGQRARLADGRQIAGKTGTSQSFRDAWFIGYSADLVAGVWVGNDDDTPTRDVTGGGLPARIWHDFMTAAHGDLPGRPLAAPPPRARSAHEERLASYYSSLSSAFRELSGDP